MIILLGLVSVIGIYTYQQFSSIVKSISNDSNSDSILVTSKSLLNYISDAENSVKSFSLTKDTIYLERFYESADMVDNKLVELDDLSKGSALPINYIDTLESLINKKFDLLDDLLSLQDQFRVQTALDKVVNKLEKDIAVYKKKKKVRVVTTVPIKEKGTSEPQKKKSRKLLGFLRRKSKDKEVRREVVVQKRDTLIEVVNTNKDIKFSKINEQVERVKREEKSIESLLKLQELELIVADKEITQKIKNYLSSIEEYELLSLEKKTEEARAIMKNTNIQIAIFCVIAGGLILLMSYVIINYVRSNNKYRKALKVAKRKAEDLARTKEKFIANMTHEIRTPMNAIAGFTEQLTKGPLTQNQNNQLSMISKSVDHLLFVINDVLDYSKLQAGKVNLEKNAFLLKELTDNLITISSPLIKEKKLKIYSDFNLDENIIVLGDPYRLRQILLNLISNALKFTEVGSVRLKVEGVLEKDNKIKITFKVIDTGIGMNEIQIVKVFEEFEQAEDSITRNYGGTGLGLSIVSILVELHKGEIEVKSKPQSGTTVEVSIPYLLGDKKDLLVGEEEKKEIDLGFFKGLKILIVDDTAYNRKLLVTILNKYHISYTEASNGQEAFESVKSQEYDLILMDARMPVVNGLEASIMIRKMNNLTPIIALTAAVTKEDRIAYKNAGMNGFLAKPFKEQDLMNEINNVLNHEKHYIKKDEPKEIEEFPVSFIDLKDLSNGDDAFYKDMLETFIITTNETLNLMQGAFELNDWDMVAEYAHKACSPCKHLSANKLYKGLKTIELNCRNNEKLDEIEVLLKHMHEEFKKVSKIVQQELEKFK